MLLTCIAATPYVIHAWLVRPSEVTVSASLGLVASSSALPAGGQGRFEVYRRTAPWGPRTRNLDGDQRAR
jgi:hypothetical protein